MRVWDPRAPDAPAAAFLPAAGKPAPDAWCVAIGNAHSAEERCILAGYANGDIKMFDLRGGGAAVRWETNVGKGVCGVQVGAVLVGSGVRCCPAGWVLLCWCLNTHACICRRLWPLSGGMLQLPFAASVARYGSSACRSLTGGTLR